MFQNIAGMLSYMALTIGRLLEINQIVENISITAQRSPDNRFTNASILAPWRCSHHSGTFRYKCIII